VERARVDERYAGLGDSLSDAARARDVRLLGVIGILPRQRAGGLCGEQVDARRLTRKEGVERAPVADVGGLDARAPILEPPELRAIGCVPVVGERDAPAFGERELGQLRADVPGSQDQERTLGARSG
jgi:hypothetical protein